MFRQNLPGASGDDATFSFSFAVTFRPCRRRDLHDLEWFGMFYAQRELIEEAFARHLAGENVMILAIANRFPVGQVWIDLEKKRNERVGVLWALRVLPPFQGHGLGTRLISEAEAMLQKRSLVCAELAVEKSNPRAKSLYQRLGYRVIGSHVERWDYLTPEGQCVEAHADEWVLQKTLAPAADSTGCRRMELPGRSRSVATGFFAASHKMEPAE